MTTQDRLTELSAIRTRLAAQLRVLDAELRALDDVIAGLEEDAANTQRNLERFNLGEVWGATKLGRYLGVSRNTAYKLMRTDLAHLSWEDPNGRLRITAKDAEAHYTLRVA